MLAATRLDERAMPSLIEGSAPSGRLRDAVADAWGMPRGATVAGGAGDQAAGAVGVGVVAPGQAFLSLGTSGVYFAASDRFAPNPERAVHAFCHCLPGRWHQMSVILSAAACLSWVADVCGARDEDALLTEIAAGPDTAGQEIFLPYLSGERTPHNDPYAKGVFFGLSHTTGRASLGRAVLEGVAFALADAQDALIAGGAQIERVFVIGGGARSALWGDILASVLGRELDYATGADLGPALGAARLAILADRGAPAEDVCKAPAVARTALPRSDLAEVYARRRTTFRRLYADLRETFRAC
jgi:xylulokinase